MASKKPDSTVKEQRICILSFSGNVGKSLLSNYLFMPRMKGAKHLQIETINSDGTNAADVLLLDGESVETAIEEILISPSVVLDIGASNVESIVQGFEEWEGSAEIFDMFVIPVTPNNKVKADTLATIDALIELGISPEKIKIVYNMVKPKTNFTGITDHLKKLGVTVCSATVPESKFFAKAQMLDLTVDDVLADQTDYKALIDSEEDETLRIEYATRLMLPMIAKSLHKKLNAVAAELGI